jgi:hypothetical protein
LSDEFNPYASPQSIQPSPPPSFERGVVPFASGHQRAVWATALFAVVVLLEVSFAVVCVMQNELLADIQRGQKFLPATLQANDTRYAAAATLVTLALLPTTIVFLMWVHRAYRNLPALGAKGLEHTPGWAVGWYFVPIANLVKPYQAMAETWRNSDPDAIGAPFTAISIAPVLCWWLAFLARNFTAQIVVAVYQVEPQRQTIQNLASATMWEIVIRAVSIVAALLAILVIHTIDKNQQARFDKISAASPVAASPFNV